MPSDPNFPDEPNFAYLVGRKHGLPCFRIQGKATVVSGVYHQVKRKDMIPR
jgi:hypothetical protein